MLNLDDKVVLAKNEQFFIKAIISPLWTLVNKFFQGDLERVYKNVEKNI